MTELEQAATDYVAARIRLAGSDSSSMLERAIAVDCAWHALHIAAGVPVAECCSELEEELALERDTRTGRRIKTEEAL